MFEENKRNDHRDESNDDLDELMEGSLISTDSDEGLFVNNNRQGFMDDSDDDY